MQTEQLTYDTIFLKDPAAHVTGVIPMFLPWSYHSEISSLQWRPETLSLWRGIMFNLQDSVLFSMVQQERMEEEPVPYIFRIKLKSSVKCWRYGHIDSVIR